jgi:general stress protein 26
MTAEEDHLEEIVAGFATGMLVTRASDGGMHARPLAVVRDPKQKSGGSTYFATSIESPKIGEIEADPNVVVTFQGKARWAVIYGAAEIVRDPELIGRLWSEEWRVFFPDGWKDKSLCLLAITPKSGEYWDDRGPAGAEAVARSAAALATGRRLDTDEAHDHAKVRQRGSRR